MTTEEPLPWTTWIFNGPRLEVCVAEGVRRCSGTLFNLWSTGAGVRAHPGQDCPFAIDEEVVLEVPRATADGFIRVPAEVRRVGQDEFAGLLTLELVHPLALRECTHESLVEALANSMGAPTLRYLPGVER